MGITIAATKLDGVMVVTPDIYPDDRGYFLETWHKAKYTEGGILPDFVQVNRSFSIKNVVRGLHYQLEKAQAKLISVCQGEVFDVAVDLRQTSPTFGQWLGVYLSAENGRQLFVPEGFAHGFAVTSEKAGVIYQCGSLYDPKDEHGIVFDDPDINIDWPVKDPILSIKDRELKRLSKTPQDLLF